MAMFQQSDVWLPEALDAAGDELRRRGFKPETINNLLSPGTKSSANNDGLFVKASEITRLSQANGYPVEREPSPPKKPSLLAIISLAFACSSFVTPFVLTYLNLQSLGVLVYLGPVGGIVFGHWALLRIKHNGELGGKGIAICGMGIGYAFFALIIFLGLLFVKMFSAFR